MKILLLCTTSNSIIGFRKGLIEKLQAEGHEIFAAAFDEDNKDLILSRKINFYNVENANRSLNPFKILSLKKRYKKLIKQTNPDVVFTFMLKPNVFGTVAAKKAGVPKIFSMVEGAGDVFINNGVKWKLIRALVCKLYKKAFRCANKVFFLNNDDKNEFVNRKLVEESKCEIVFGIGVDLQKFVYKPMNNTKTFLMIARMLKTKGIIEYCRAARVVKENYPDANFNYVGGEGTVCVSDIQEYIDDGTINYLGTTNDVRPFLEDCSVYVLPSYREGMSVSIMEAEAIGRAIITTDTNGCRDVIIDGKNGFLVPVKDVDSLVEKIEWFLRNGEETEKMGESSRLFAEENFDSVKINEKIYSVIIG